MEKNCFYTSIVLLTLFFSTLSPTFNEDHFRCWVCHGAFCKSYVVIVEKLGDKMTCLGIDVIFCHSYYMSCLLLMFDRVSYACECVCGMLGWLEGRFLVSSSTDHGWALSILASYNFCWILFFLFYFILIFIIEVKCAHTLTVQCVVVVDVVGVFSVSKPDVPNHG